MRDADHDQGLQSHFGTLEYAILDVLWTTAPADVAGCVARLTGEQAYTTVKTVMDRLVKKGHLRRERQPSNKQAFLYWPVRSRQEVRDELARRRSDELLAGFGPLAVSTFVKAVESDSGRLDQLRRLLEDIEKGERGEG